ncbi:SDR family NAD(P)-dependent oxidoreductase [Streptomyces solisilvae]|uniref:type I polyketide synthase n=1 Tax=Streptomyces malaysiensis TaxID=92644 RepID=UPI0036C3CEA9
MAEEKIPEALPTADEMSGEPVAVVGMSARFPGAADVTTFWANLRSGTDSITRFSERELLDAGVSPELLADPRYVRAGAVLDGYDLFDASFFGYTPQEARVMDPQQRLFLEESWHALEDAGHAPERFSGAIGVFGGSALSSYLVHNVLPDPSAVAAVGETAMLLGNDKDSLTTRVAHAFDLTGPCYTVQSYCSTSLVAVCAAAGSLTAGECDMALAGGVAVDVPHRVGYLYQDGGMLSPDGRCRALDANAQGTPVGSGVGVVVLRRLADALADGDHVYAVLRGWAVGNDGGRKVGFTAPGVRGQSAVVSEALAHAGLAAGDVDYVETHGTGTALGDAAELSALKQVFTEGSACAIGSVKTNIGHLDRAAGVAGLIKTALAFHHEEIPPTLHHSAPNPELASAGGRLHVVTRNHPWPRGSRPRRAGVSAFGIGGTNAHVVLEESPLPRHDAALRPRPHQLLVWSGRTQAAAEEAGRRLEDHRAAHPDLPVADIAFSLQVGRQLFEHRRAMVVSTADGTAVSGPFTRADPWKDRPLSLLLPPLAPAQPLCDTDLYALEPRFAAVVDEGARTLREATGQDPRTSLAGTPAAGILLQLALIRLLDSWGLRPSVVGGHGLGAVAAAFACGVLSEAEALSLAASAAAAASEQDAAPPSAWPGELSWPSSSGVACLSMATGRLLTPDEASAPDHWTREACHLPQPGRAGGWPEALDEDSAVLVLGPPPSPPAGRSAPVVSACGDQPALTEAMAQLWLAGVRVDWEAYHDGRGARRRPLPGYPFQRERFWIDPPPAPGAADTGPAGVREEQAREEAAQPDGTGQGGTAEPIGLHEPLWRVADAAPAGEEPAGQRGPGSESGPVLVFTDGSEMGDELCRRLGGAGHEVVPVRPGDAFETSEDGCVLRPDVPEDYRTLLARVVRGRRIGAAVYLWGTDAVEPEEAWRLCFSDLGFLTRALGESTGGAVRLLAVTRGAQAVSPQETPVAEQAVTHGVCMVAGQEYPNLHCSSLDLPPASQEAPAAGQLADLIAAELREADPGEAVAYRGGRRRVRDYAVLPGAAARAAEPVQAPIREDGVYLITGGLGTVGLLLAGHLNRTAGVRTVLTGRHGLPPREEWESALRSAPPHSSEADRIRALRQLEEAGAQITVERVDAADGEAMRELLARTRERFGRLDGVFHAAGVTDVDSLVAVRDLAPDSAGTHFAAKVAGATVLEEVLRDEPVDFCVLFSSMSAILGGLGMVGYVSANAFLDAVAHRRRGGGTTWLSVNWDTWEPTLDRLDTRLGATMAEHSMPVDRALLALETILSDPRPQTLVAVGDLTLRRREWHFAGQTADGDRRTQAYPRPELVQPYVPAIGRVESRMTVLWGESLGIDRVGRLDNLFDLGGNSLMALHILQRVHQTFGVAVPAVALFENPTPAALCEHVAPRQAGDRHRAAELTAPTPPPPPEEPRPAPAPVTPAVSRRPVTARSAARTEEPSGDRDQGIAVIGMSGRFPGASDTEQFWRNLITGTESIRRFTDEELLASGVDPRLLADPAYVRARPTLDDVRGFDAAFFGYSPRDAKVADPQQRILLECAWEAMEQAGYATAEHRGRVGVFAGANLSTYMLDRLEKFRDELDVDIYELITGNDKDALATNVSYKLGLTGPSVSVQTFCSTSLVGVHLACRALRDAECEMALAGGVSVRVPDTVGHLFQEGGMESPDGHVRTFDAGARGSMFGDGAAVVLLKPLQAALADGDTVLAVIRGSAMNNDGAEKFGFTAPSVAGQAVVVSAALADAGVDPEDIGYIEAHGTATELGDPIEVAALTRAFGPGRTKQYCHIGSVKTNVGHLDRASGVTGLIKIILSLREERIPPTLHYRSPNPEIDFATGPFRVAAEEVPWPRDEERPRIAGLNSLGMGGTNVHVVVQEPPPRAARPEPGPRRRHHVLPISARSAAALDASCDRLAHHLDASPHLRLPDVAFTLQAGRRTFEHRRVVVVDSLSQAAAGLGAESTPTVPSLSRTETMLGRPVGFLLAGVGEHYPGMVAQLYRTEPAFRRWFDTCRELLGEAFPEDLVRLLAEPLPEARPPAEADRLFRPGEATPTAHPRQAVLNRTDIAQPAAFVAEYALARTLMEWGVHPTTMIGYSVGEYVAACLAGVLSLPDALRLVSYRARLIAMLPAGSMLAVALTEEALAVGVPDLAERGLDVAVTNGSQTVVAGPPDAVRATAELLWADTVANQILDTTHAFHSRMLEPAAEALSDWVADHITLNAPQIPYISNVTGDVATKELVTDPAYWSRHMCGTVRFGQGLAELLKDPALGFVEIGPGQSLGALLRAHPDCERERWSLVVPTLPAAAENRPDDIVFVEALGKLWLAGAEVDWAAYHGGTDGREDAAAHVRPGRVPLPTYPFQRQEYWLEAGRPGRSGTSGPRAEEPSDLLSALASLPGLPEERWLHLPMWRQTPSRPAAAGSACWLVYSDTGDGELVAEALARRLAPLGGTVVRVRPGDRFAGGPEGFTVRPGDGDDATALVSALRSQGRLPQRVAHLWSLGAPPSGADDPRRPADLAAVAARRGLYSLAALARAAEEVGMAGWTLDVVASGTQRVLRSDAERMRPECSTVLGACRLIPMEYPGTEARLIDVAPEHLGSEEADRLVDELLTEPADKVVAFRAGHRWVPGYEVREQPPDGRIPGDGGGGPVRREGVYLITGGLGGIGLAMAKRLVDDFDARVVLFGRTAVPPREQWEELLADSGTSVPLRRRLEALTELERQGARVEVVAGDVADRDDVRRALAAARGRFGTLHGVVHAAGVPGVGLMQFKSNDDMDDVLAPKVAGTEILAEELRGSGIDFLALFSSVTSATGGGAGQIDYCAANAYLDAFAQADPLPGVRVVSIGWGEWTWNGWATGLDGYDRATRTFFEEHRERFGITFDQGWRSLLRVLAADEPHIVVSTQDFASVVCYSSRYTIDDVRAAPDQNHGGSDGHPRPELSVPFVAPQSDAECTIARLWGEALGLADVGVNDNFFELGGNSLIGVRIVAQVRRALELDQLAPHVLYQAPTVAALAALSAGADEAAAATRSAENLERIGKRRRSLGGRRPK